MRSILSEKNLVVVLFIMVLVVFAFAREDSKKLEKIYINSVSSTINSSQPIGQVAKQKVLSEEKKENSAITVNR